MSNIKKSNKIIKSPAPATKPAKTSARKAAPAEAASPAVQIAAIAAAAISAPVKPEAPKPVVATITALIDVGFGNSLYIRGEGPGLSWDRGVPMTCIGPAQWYVSLGESQRPYTFKLLVNDVTWSVGPNLTVVSGETIAVTPQF